ncbi:MAG: hypothetical protein RL572_2047, partial [Pseudomonadota bacterium]
MGDSIQSGFFMPAGVEVNAG